MTWKAPRVVALAVATALVVLAVGAGVTLGGTERSDSEAALADGDAEDRGSDAPADEAGADRAGADDDAGAADGRPVVLALAGEVHFEGGLAGLPDDPLSNLGPLSSALRSADVAMVNLETAIVEGDAAPASKELEDPDNRYWFEAPPESLGVLARSGVDVASVANNHGADYGRPGLRAALAAAERSPLSLVGVGRTPAEAFRPYRTTVRGTEVAVLAADASARESADATWSVQPGSGLGLAAARQDPPSLLLSSVRQAAASSDLVVVYLHWGREGESCPTTTQQRLAGQLAQAGADVVVGSHAHVLLGSGMREDTFVSYGLGNFAWYHGIQSETGVLRLRVREGRVVRQGWVPGTIPAAGGTPVRVRGAERSASIARLDSLRGCTDLEPVTRATDDTTDKLPDYAATVQTLDADTRRTMRGSSHDPATCPVGLGDLRELTMSHVGFDGEARTGRMIVHREVAREVVRVFRSLYEGRFPIRRMRLVDAYGGDDDASMAANNTSGYNCRRVAGQSSWSEHAYGRAVDVNPVQNPYVTGSGSVLPPAGRRFASVDRSVGAEAARGVIREDDVVTGAFGRAGWTWGGSWSSPDYQHFSAP